MRIMISCGEASGDMYAGALAAELRRRVPDAEIFGFGGPRLKDAGGRLVADYSPLSVTGITEAIKIIPRSFAMLRKLVDAARELAAARLRRHRFSRLQFPLDGGAPSSRNPDRLLRQSTALGVAPGTHGDDERVRRSRAGDLPVRGGAVSACGCERAVRRSSAGRPDSHGSGSRRLSARPRSRYPTRRPWPCCQAAGATS